jgi:putative acetyltransferase
MLDHGVYTIRRLEAPDIHALRCIVSESGAALVSQGSVSDFFEAFRSRRSAYLVATVNGQLVGGAGIAKLDEAGAQACELTRMYLRPEIRGRGLGQTLLHRALDLARQMVYSQCYFEAVSGISCPVRFLERHGFEKVRVPRQESNSSWLRMRLYAEANANLYI